MIFLPGAQSKAPGDRKEILVKRIAVPALYAILVFTVEWSVFGHGLPMLRHDWRFPSTHDALGPMLATFFNGWLDQGIGSPQPYPTFFYIGFILWPFHTLLTPLAAVVLIVTAALLIVAMATSSIAKTCGTGTLAATGLAAFAILNPWVYAKLVAGHIVMVLAYALILALVAEMLRPEPRPHVLVALSALSVMQIEFSLIVLVPLAYWLVRKRRFEVLVALAMSIAPLAVGIAASFSSLLVTPYNLEWQRAQSIPLLSALTLTGYQFGYASAFEPWRWAIGACILVVALGVRNAWRDSIGKAVAIIGACCLVLATGTKGPIAPLYTYAVTHITESGVFRELYDLLAIVAIAYIVIAARAMANTRAAAALFAIGAISLLVPWIVHPAYDWFVSARTISHTRPLRDPSVRVAYFPAFQPLSYNDKGSGVDPDAFEAPEFALPINEAAPAYPVDAALARAQRRDTQMLSALSVSQMIGRRQYLTRVQALNYQLALGTGTDRDFTHSELLHALPLAALYVGAPHQTSIGHNPWEDSVSDFVHDSTIFHGDPHTINPSQAWIDARLAFISNPQWANPWGGAATVGEQPLLLPSATKAILAQTSAKIVDGYGHIVAVNSNTLHWWRTTASRIRCIGRCLVVAASCNLPIFSEHEPPAPYRALSLERRNPWFATVELPAGLSGTLRYNVQYDPGWIGIDGHSMLTHVMLDGTFNAWIVPARDKPRSIVLIDAIAAVQFLLEILAAVTVFAAVGLSWAHASNRSHLFRDEHRIDLKRS